MDAYTKTTRAWLDGRFQTTDTAGVYVAHQPIYGFSEEHCEPGLVEKYIRTYQIMKSLSRIEFSSLLDAGGAEGLKARLACDLFGATVQNCDLSEEACKRSRSIFGLSAVAADLHDLPYADDSFDIVLCSESLEHVADFRRAVGELVRVAGRAVVVTVPRESAESVHRNIEDAIPHAHIHSLDVHSFDHLRESGLDVVVRRIVSPRLRFTWKVLPPRPVTSTRFPKFMATAYNAMVPALRRVLNVRAVGFVMCLDAAVCRLTRRSDALLVIITKSGSTAAPTRSISATDIVNFRVPLHRPGALTG